MGICIKSKMAAKNTIWLPERSFIELKFQCRTSQTLTSLDMAILLKNQTLGIGVGGGVVGWVVVMDHNNATLWPYLAS